MLTVGFLAFSFHAIMSQGHNTLLVLANMTSYTKYTESHLDKRGLDKKDTLCYE